MNQQNPTTHPPQQSQVDRTHPSWYPKFLKELESCYPAIFAEITSTVVGRNAEEQHAKRLAAEAAASVPEVISACPRDCPAGECYCPDGSEPRACGHGPGGTCNNGHCYACDACYCGEDF